MNFFLVNQGIRYFFGSRHARGHGIHSPFVYSLIRSVFIDTQIYSEYATIEQHRKLLQKNTQYIEVTDFGAGSQQLQSPHRMIGKIAQTSLSPKKYAQLLFRMCRYFKPQNVLEIGTSLGISGAYMAAGYSKANIITLEGSQNIADIAQNTFQSCGLSNITVRVGNFSDTLLPALQELGHIDMAFIDGNHTKKATLNYFEQLYPYCNADSILIFDDIYWSADMHDAWKTICNNPRVSLSIDLFKLGIVFFRTGVAKQNFRIRF